MPIGPFGEIIGTTGTLEGLGDATQNYKSKVIAPRNPKLIKGSQEKFKVFSILLAIFFIFYPFLVETISFLLVF